MYQSASPFALRKTWGLPFSLPIFTLFFPPLENSISHLEEETKKFHVDSRQDRREISTGLQHSSKSNRFRSMSVSQPKTQMSHYVATTKHFTGYRAASWIGIRSYSRETRGDRSECSLRKTRTTNSQETNASRVSNSQVESHYVAPPPPPPPSSLNPAQNTIPLIPQSVVGNWLLITSVAFNDQFPRSQNRNIRRRGSWIAFYLDRIRLRLVSSRILNKMLLRRFDVARFDERDLRNILIDIFTSFIKRWLIIAT